MAWYVRNLVLKIHQIIYVFSLGILDIFGFESFNKNGMEQIYVNYVNEKMQQYFIESYVKNSHDNLQEENFIEICNPLHTINLYKECLNVIEENLFLILNDVCKKFFIQLYMKFIITIIFIITIFIYRLVNRS